MLVAASASDLIANHLRIINYFLKCRNTDFKSDTYQRSGYKDTFEEMHISAGIAGKKNSPRLLSHVMAIYLLEVFRAHLETRIQDKEGTTLSTKYKKLYKVSK